jgi:protein-S-isoprenylcysteine O-methyltransferase Ste14
MAALKILPPLWALLFELAGLGISQLYPWRSLIDLRSIPVALIFVVVGWGLAFWSRSLFAASGTTIIPANPVNKALVVGGPYGFSRNPMYVGVILMTVGVAFLVGAIPMFLVPPALFLLLALLFLPFEEEKMQRQFGREYDDYRMRVRRWL